jgi:hypothetical protein
MDSFSSGAGWIQEIPEARAIPLIQQRIISRCLFDTERAKYGIAAMIRIFALRCRKCGGF